VTRDALRDHLRRDFVISDGSTGVLLGSWGLPAGQCPDTWNLENPAQVERVARSYADVGAQVVTTNTINSNRISLGDCGYGERVAEVNAAGVAAARRGAAGRAWVAGSMGPTGKLLQPLGDLDPALAASAYQEQAEALAAAGADLIVAETFFDLAEATLAVQAAASTGLAVLATLAFDESGRTMMGVSPEQAAVLADHGAAAVGLNCGRVSLEQAAALVARFAATGVPVVVQPNAGIARLEGGVTVFPEPPAALGQWSRRYLEAGARIIGGCCGTKPEHIAAIVQALRPGPAGG